MISPWQSLFQSGEAGYCDFALLKKLLQLEFPVVSRCLHSIPSSLRQGSLNWTLGWDSDSHFKAVYETKQVRKKARRASGQIVLSAEPVRSISSHVMLLTRIIVEDFEVGQKFLNPVDGIHALSEDLSRVIWLCRGLSLLLSDYSVIL